MSTPDLRTLIGLLSGDKTALQNFSVDFATGNSFPRSPTAKKYSLSTMRFAHGGISSYMIAKQLRSR